MKEELNKPPLFFVNKYSDKRVNINQGGTASGKTYTLDDMFFVLGLEEPNQIITIVGQDVPNLKKGAYRDAKRIWGDSELYKQFYTKNETDRIFTCKNGSVIEFTSYQDEQDAKSGKRDYLFINEAQGISFDIYWQLQMRTAKKVYIDYNPTFRFWAHDLHNEPDVKVIISDHRNNPYLTDEQHERIEGIKDPELFKVYARGLTGKIEGLILQNWELCDDMPQDFKARYIGLDFGFTNDPTTVIDVRLSNGELWIDEIEYKTGMLNSDIALLFKENNITRINTIADSAEPKSIAELKGYGLTIEGAQKGADSIKNGIDILKRYKLNITKRSTNVRKELLSYKWAVDRDGRTLNKPIEDFNHSIDAIRYVALNKFNSVPKARGVKHATF